MILNILRLIFILILIIVIIYDFKLNMPFIKDSNNQLIIAIFILMIFFIVDYTIGFIVALIFLIFYYKYYSLLVQEKYSAVVIEDYDDNKEDGDVKNKNKEDIKNKNKGDIKNNLDCCNNIKIELLDYISPELLIKAQNNIFDNNNLKKEIDNYDKTKSFDIQGLFNNDVKGFDFNDNYDIDNYSTS